MSVLCDNATNEYINVGSGSSIDNITLLTITAWINMVSFGDSTSGRIFDKDGGNSNPGYSLQCNNAGTANRTNTLAFFARWNAGANYGYWTAGDNALSTGSWIHVACTYDRGSASNDPLFYVDGVLKTTYEIFTPSGSAMNDAAISGFWGSTSAGVARAWDGHIEDGRVFNVILTANEISLLAAGYRGPIGGEVDWHSFTSYVSAGPTVEGVSLSGTNYSPDLSGNGNTGTPVNTPTGKVTVAPRYGVAI